MSLPRPFARPDRNHAGTTSSAATSRWRQGLRMDPDAPATNINCDMRGLSHRPAPDFDHHRVARAGGDDDGRIQVTRKRRALQISESQRKYCLRLLTEVVDVEPDKLMDLTVSMSSLGSIDSKPQLGQPFPRNVRHLKVGIVAGRGIAARSGTDRPRPPHGDGQQDLRI